MKAKYPTNLTGLVFTRLLVQSLTRKTSKHSFWMCLCACGEQKEVARNSLVTKHTKSCGCLSRETSKSRMTAYRARIKSSPQMQPRYTEGNIRCLFKRMQKDRKKWEWDISFSEFEAVIFKPCFYCGIEPTKLDALKIKRNGIDRKNSSLGYTKDNIVPCCWPCNKAKGATESEEFIARCLLVANFHRKT